MRFLLDANLPRAAAAAVAAAGHEAVDSRDAGLRGAKDPAIARYAREHQMAIVTRDFDFADIRNYPPEDYAGLVVLELPDDAVASDVCGLLSRFLRDASALDQLPGRLAIVDPTRVRFRPRPKKGGTP